MIGCEQRTQKWKKKFNSLSLNYSNELDDDSEITIQMMCFCLGQMFETEIDYSIVQKMREALGIVMPGNFCLYCESDNSYYVNELQDPVNLNKWKKKNGIRVWEPPTLGQSRAAFGSMIYNNNINVSDELSSDDFLEKWTSLTNCRNESAHTRPIEKATLDECWKSFNIVWQKYLPSMIKIKNELRPPVQRREVV